MPGETGGITLTGLEWLGTPPRSVLVEFAHTPATPRHYQLYAGRRQIGQSAGAGVRVITGSLLPSVIPEPLALVAVLPEERTLDLGDAMPPRPFARVRIKVTAAGFPADSDWIELRSGTSPGGSVVDTNVVGRLPWRGNGVYTFDVGPLASGTWNFRAVGIDAVGNAGTVLNFSHVVTAMPPDVARNASNGRFSLATASGTLTVTTQL